MFGIALKTKDLKIANTYKTIRSPVSGVAQWIECRAENQSVAGLIPSQDICLG